MSSWQRRLLWRKEDCFGAKKIALAQRRLLWRKEDFFDAKKISLTRAHRAVSPNSNWLQTAQSRDTQPMATPIIAHVDFRGLSPT